MVNTCITPSHRRVSGGEADDRRYWNIKGTVMKIRLLLYKAKQDGKWLDNGISLWTWLFNMGTPPYSHAEIWLPETDSKFVSFDNHPCVPPLYWGTCYTSTMGQVRGKNSVAQSGSCKRLASKVLKHPERWDYIDIEVNDLLYENALTWADCVVADNKGYDLKAVWSFFLPWKIHDDDKYICSEFAACFLRICGIDVPSVIPSPRRLARDFVRGGYKIRSLV